MFARKLLAKMTSQLLLSCHNWVTSALGGRAEEVHKQSNYVLVDLIVCYSSRPARGCLINSNETSAPGSFDTALPHQPSLWNELIAGRDVVLIIYKTSITLCSWQDVLWYSLSAAYAVENIISQMANTPKYVTVSFLPFISFVVHSSMLNT